MRDRKTVALTPAFAPSGDVTSTLATLCATPNRNLVLDKAYNRFIDTIRNSANDEGSQLLVGLAERKQSISMMASRLTQLTKFTKALKSFNFPLAGEALGLTEIKGKRRRTALVNGMSFEPGRVRSILVTSVRSRKRLRTTFSKFTSVGNH